MRKTLTLRHWNWVLSIPLPNDNPSDWPRRREAVKRATEQQDHAALARESATVVQVLEEDFIVFDGHLRRLINGSYRWSDGTPEPRVEDLYFGERYSFLILSDLVEVPVKEAKGPLAWVAEGHYPTGRSGDYTGPLALQASGRITHLYADPITGDNIGTRVIPPVYLVPLDEWEKWSWRLCDAQWDTKDGPEIHAKARSLGWEG